ncbi:MAG TPA: hypothetical protein VHU82_00215 [Vicinamibacterales bacterium]|jgi:hypothetical protein|nr:hypothetical protein [Vicinamibacterales bacterium]
MIRGHLFTPASWNRHGSVIAISDAMATMLNHDLAPPSAHTARIRIQVEFIEMPDLKLSKSQIRRLCDLPSDLCDAALSALVASGFLRQRGDGSFLRSGLGGQSEAFSGGARTAH